MSLLPPDSPQKIRDLSTGTDLWKILWASLVGLALAGGAFAEPFAFYVDRGNQENSILFRMDLETPIPEEVGAAPLGLRALQFDHAGRLWAVDDESLFRLEPATGHSVRIGPLGDLPVVSAVDLAVSPEGNLWMSQADSPDSRLYSISLSTGRATLRAQVTESVYGIGFVEEKLILSASELLEFDLGSGAVTVLEPGASGQFALAMDSVGQTLYLQSTILVSTLPITLRSFDLETGVSTILAQEFASAHRAQGLAICSRGCRGDLTAIPTANAVGLAALAIFLAIAGAALLRRL